MSGNNGPGFVLFSCDCGCGKVTKIDISKYTKRVRKGLQLDYGFRPKPIKDVDLNNHRCPDCGQKCKAPNGSGTVAALDIERFGEVHQNIMKIIAAHDHATIREITLWLDVQYQYKTTENTVHSRVSDLRAWRLVEAVELEGPTKPTGTKYESSQAIAYKIDRHRAEIVEKDDWQTWRLRAIDGGVSFQIEGFGGASQA